MSQILEFSALFAFCLALSCSLWYLEDSSIQPHLKSFLVVASVNVLTMYSNPEGKGGST